MNYSFTRYGRNPEPLGLEVGAEALSSTIEEEAMKYKS
jgi:hypothetical protein